MEHRCQHLQAVREEGQARNGFAIDRVLDILPRFIGAGTDASSVKASTVDQLTAIGKQNGVKFIVRGGLLAVNSENTGEETKTSIQLYVDIVSVESATINSLRVEGIGTQKGTASGATQLNSIDVTSSKFRDSSLAVALSEENVRVWMRWPFQRTAAARDCRNIWSVRPMNCRIQSRLDRAFIVPS